MHIARFRQPVQYVRTADGLQHGLTSVDVLEPLPNQLVDLLRCLPQSPVTRFYRLPDQVWNVLLHPLGHGWRQRLVLGSLDEQDWDIDCRFVKSFIILVDSRMYTKDDTPLLKLILEILLSVAVPIHLEAISAQSTKKKRN